MTRATKRILAVASKGGHWEQLMIIKKCFLNAQVVYATTEIEELETMSLGKIYKITDANQNTPIKMIKTFLEVHRIIREVRPATIITTGAAPGLLSILVGKLYGARTVWIDSVANSERLSLSGRLAGYVADVWITQWQHLAKSTGPIYIGSLL